MNYISTRATIGGLQSSQVIEKGIADDGGLFIPEQFTRVSMETIEKLKDMTYQQRAYELIKGYFDDFQEDDLKECIDSAYNTVNFSHSDIAPVTTLTDTLNVLELWHGPTSAFKDFALQLLPRLMVKAMKYSGVDKKIVILVATSGDTGKAAMEGFKDVPGIQVIVFYPNMGVSEMQKMQMITQEGNNIDCVGVLGNFDDAQTMVKSVFVDKEFNRQIYKRGYQLSSANSINWGRLAPQIVYYFSGYADMLKQGRIKPGEPINILIPSGNFGNFVGAYFAQSMGLPVRKLICASNDNKVLTDFFRTGTYSLERDFKLTTSPAMDILISSNLERFLYLMSGRSSEKINGWMKQLKEKSGYTVDPETLSRISSVVWAECATEAEVSLQIKEVFEKHSYLIDTHTAVGFAVYKKYLDKTKDPAKTLIVSTASPFKFNRSVAQSVFSASEIGGLNEFDLMKKISSRTGIAIPKSLRDLDKKTALHTRVCDKLEIPECVDGILQ